MEDFEGIARRARRRTTWIAIVGLVVGAVLGVVLSGGEPVLERLLTVVGFGCSVGGLAGTFSMLVATSRLAPAVDHPVRGIDAAQRRTIRRSVFAGSPIEPHDSESARRALDWARASVVVMPLSLAQFLLLYAGIAGPQLPDLVRGDSFVGPFSRIFVPVIVVVAVVLTAQFTRRLRGARRYLAAVDQSVEGVR